MRRMIAASRRSQQGSAGEAASFRKVFSFAKSLAAAGQADRREPPGGAEQRRGAAARNGSAERQRGAAARNGSAERQRGAAARSGSAERRCGTAMRNSDAEQRCGTAMRNSDAEQQRGAAARNGRREWSALDAAPKTRPPVAVSDRGSKGRRRPGEPRASPARQLLPRRREARTRRKISCADTASAACPSGDPRHPGSSPASWSRLRSSASRR
jgi:hypothetical protein